MLSDFFFLKRRVVDKISLDPLVWALRSGGEKNADNAGRGRRELQLMRTSS